MCAHCKGNKLQRMKARLAVFVTVVFLLTGAKIRDRKLPLFMQELKYSNLSIGIDWRLLRLFSSPLLCNIYVFLCIYFSDVLVLKFPGVSIPEELSKQTFLVGALLLLSQESSLGLADFSK